MPQRNATDPLTRWGIIVLTLLLVALVVFFLWYNNRSLTPGDSRTTDSSQEKTGFFARMFSADPEAVASSPDADIDGLDDKAEATLGTNPAKPDSDDDGLTDREEANVYKTNPLNPDSDGDGMKDGEEIRSRRDPRDNNPNAIWPPRPSADALQINP